MALGRSPVLVLGLLGLGASPFAPAAFAQAIDGVAPDVSVPDIATDPDITVDPDLTLDPGTTAGPTGPAQDPLAIETTPAAPDIIPSQPFPDDEADPRDGVVEDEPGADVLRLRFSEEFSASNSRESRFRTLAALSYETTTPLSQLRAEIGSGIDYFPFEEDGRFDGRGVDYTLAYDRSTPNASFSASARARTEDLDTIRRASELTGESLIFDQGRLERTRLSSDLGLGEAGRLGLSFGADYLREDYVGSTDPDLNDVEEVRLSATTRVDLTPLVSLSPYARYVETDEDGPTATDTEEQSGGLQFSARVTPILQASGRVYYETVTSSTQFLLVEAEGTGGTATLTLDRPLGAIRATYATQITTAGRRQDVILGREFDTPAFALDGQLGVSVTEDEDPVVIVGASLERELPDGSLTATAATNITTENVVQQEVVQSLAVVYTERVNRNLSYSLEAAYDRSVNTTLDFRDEVVTVSAEFDRQLTRDWGITAGASVSSRLDDDGDDDRRIFFSLSRDFVFGR